MPPRHRHVLGRLLEKECAVNVCSAVAGAMVIGARWSGVWHGHESAAFVRCSILEWRLQGIPVRLDKVSQR